MKIRSTSHASLLALVLLLPGALAFAADPAADPAVVREVLDSDQAALLEVGGRGCGTVDASPGEVGVALAQVHALRDRFGVVGPIGGTIDVAFHNLVDDGEGYVSDLRFAEQIRVMNRRYAGSGFQFRLKSIDRADHKGWFKMRPGSGAEKKCKRALAVDPAHTLNVYTCSPGKNLLGWAYFPFSLPEDDDLNGVVIHYGSLPGGFIPNYNLGLTLVHETGHYLGLFHTFQGGCVPPGDYVDDTPFEASPAFGCPIGRNTCPQEGDDPIHNYMDYTYDECYNEFTPLQFDWMQGMVAAYRPSLLHRDELAREIGKPAAGALAGAPAGGSLEFRGAFPNPFTREALLRYSLPSRQHVSLSVYNVAGQRVANLVNREEEAGEHLVKFAPRGLAAGMYFTVLKTPDQVISRSAVFIP